MNTYAPQKPLRGCVNDANAMERLLRAHFGYTSFIKLLNAEATKARILSELRTVLEPEQGETAGSRVFFFAGHGGRALDLDGDETDRIDENLCMPDYRWDSTSTFILDDELSQTLKQGHEHAPWMRTYVVFDSCHSGTATRTIADTLTWADIEQVAHQMGVADPREAGWPLDSPALPMLAVSRQATDSPELDVLIRGEASADVTIASPGVSGGPVSHLLLSGCSAAQTCKDVPLDGDYHGIFSYCVEKTVNGNPAITWRQLQRATDQLISEGFNQNPQLEGPEEWKDQPVFA